MFGRWTEQMEAFVAESNRIEGINRPTTKTERDAHKILWSLPLIGVADLEEFVKNVAARPLRRAKGQNVRVGSHRPPPGGIEIEWELQNLLDAMGSGVFTPFEIHAQYELLHPFLDGNGRSGRALWAWHMGEIGQDPFALPFLHRFYYQTLDASRILVNPYPVPPVPDVQEERADHV